MATISPRAPFMRYARKSCSFPAEGLSISSGVNVFVRRLNV